MQHILVYISPQVRLAIPRAPVMLLKVPVYVVYIYLVQKKGTYFSEQPLPW